MNELAKITNFIAQNSKMSMQIYNGCITIWDSTMDKAKIYKCFVADESEIAKIYKKIKNKGVVQNDT